MRQILIEKTADVLEQVGSQINFKLNKTQAYDFFFKENKALHVRWPFKFKPITGGKVDFLFKAPLNLVKNGVMLADAYAENGEVYAIYVNYSGGPLTLNEGDVALEATLVETVAFRQVGGKLVGGVVMMEESKASGALVIEKAKSKKRNKKKD